MNKDEEIPSNLEGLGDLLPADLLNQLNELLQQLHQQEHSKQGGTVINIYADGSQHIDQQINIGEPGTCPPCQKEKTKEPAPATSSDEELFRFIHPSVTREQERKIHDEIKRLVSRQGIPDICSRLREMEKEKLLLHTVKPSLIYAELVRMGMPSGEGYSEKYFKNLYNR